jgi:hypothetical protein
MNTSVPWYVFISIGYYILYYKFCLLILILYIDNFNEFFYLFLKMNKLYMWQNNVWENHFLYLTWFGTFWFYVSAFFFFSLSLFWMWYFYTVTFRWYFIFILKYFFKSDNKLLRSLKIFIIAMSSILLYQYE